MATATKWLSRAPNWRRDEDDNFVEAVESIRRTKDSCEILLLAVKKLTKASEDHVKLIRETSIAAAKASEIDKGSMAYGYDKVALCLNRAAQVIDDCSEQAIKSALQVPLTSLVDREHKRAHNAKDHFRLCKYKMHAKKKELSKAKGDVKTRKALEALQQADTDQRRARRDVIESVKSMQSRKIGEISPAIRDWATMMRDFHKAAIEEFEAIANWDFAAEQEEIYDYDALLEAVGDVTAPSTITLSRQNSELGDDVQSGSASPSASVGAAAGAGAPGVVSPPPSMPPPSSPPVASAGASSSGRAMTSVVPPNLGSVVAAAAAAREKAGKQRSATSAMGAGFAPPRGAPPPGGTPPPGGAPPPGSAPPPGGAPPPGSAPPSSAPAASAAAATTTTTKGETRRTPGEGVEGGSDDEFDWEEFIDDEGTPYYYNYKTEETQWEAPKVPYRPAEE